MQNKGKTNTSILFRALIFSLPLLLLIVADTIYAELTYFHFVGQTLGYIYFPGILILTLLVATHSGLHSIDPISTGVVSCIFYYLFILLILVILRKIRLKLKK